MTSSVLKVFSLGGIVIVLLIALGAVHDLIRERQSRRVEALESIATGAGGSVQVGPPVLRVATRDENNNALVSYLLPASVSVVADVDVETRQRGIFEARVFTSKQRIKARFELPPGLGLDTVVNQAVSASLEMRVTDLRGLRGTPTITWDGASQVVEPGATGATGFHATLPPLDAATARTIESEIQLVIAGTDALAWSPAAAETLVEVSSTWKHPSFVGGFLPATRKIGADGFTAQWAVTDLATGLARDGGTETLRQASHKAFGFSLIEPVDTYALVSRATKFGLLFVLFTVVGLLLVERLAGITLHPVQYGLAGAAVTVFFLVLLALAEHLAFRYSFLAGTVACVSLLTAYLIPVLGSRKRGLCAGALFASMYGLLFTLLHAEDHALLAGTALVFGLLAATMLGTRHINWAGRSAQTAAEG